MKSSKGFTLIELAVVLAIVAILAAILTPLVTDYIDEARVTRAAADIEGIVTAVTAYKRDTGFFPAFSSRANANSDTLDTDVTVLLGPGDTPTNGSGDTLWGLTTTASLESYLNTNQLSLPTTAVGGRVSFKGPYIQLEADPWGNTYMVTAEPLTLATSDHAFAISAGPNSTLETDPTQASTGTFSSGGDDIAVRIR